MKKRVVLILLFSLGLIINMPYLTAQVNNNQKMAKEEARYETERYERACSINTQSEYKEYLELYPKGRYVTDVKNRLKDSVLWERAKRYNTLVAYNDYLQNSKFKTYATDARLAIKNLESLDEWNKISNSKRIQDFEVFLAKYPKSEYAVKATNQMYELRALEYYESGHYYLALKEFVRIGDKESISYNNRRIYEKCKEHVAYQNINEKSGVTDLKDFVDNYPNSEYTKEVSNMLALSLSKRLNVNSNESQFSEALGYARDVETRKIVGSNISAAKKRKSEHSKRIINEARRSYKEKNRRRHGGPVNFGIEIMDLSLNPFMYMDDNSYVDLIGSFNLGLGLKFGNYRAPIQFEVGVKPGVTWADIYFDDSDKFIFHLPAYARLKVNLFGEYSKGYIDITGYKNIIFDEFYESDFAVSGGFGVAWRHWDWLILYYKYNINSNEYINYSDNPNNQFLGTSFRYFF